MGHEIVHRTFDVSKSKEYIANEMDEIARYNSDSRSGLYGAIRWIDRICTDYDEAYEYLRERDNGWYEQLAVKYREYPKLEPTKAYSNLEERIKKEKEKKVAYTNAHSISSFKVEYIGCPNCGSKLKRTLLRGERCPLCNTELRSKTTMETLERYENNIKDLMQKLRAEEKKMKEKMASKAKIKWLVKIEYHV